VLKRQGYRLRLIKVGGAGGERWRAKFLWDVERLELTDDVVIVGVVPEEDLPLFYNAADLCVTPTLLEGGFAWLVMEAMACQKPVIATYAALVPPEAEEAVILVPPRNLDELVTAIAKCLDDEEGRQKMGKAGRQIIASYTWEATAQAMIGVYEAAASGARQ
jgi:glycosyltransferase involved in cell wall biosynthesis